MADLTAGGVPVEVSGLRLSSDALAATVLPTAAVPAASSSVVVGALGELGFREAGVVGLEAKSIEPAARGGRRGAGTPAGAGAYEGDGVAEVVVDVPPPPPGQGQVLLVEHEGAISWCLPEQPTGPTRSGAASSVRFRVAVPDPAADGTAEHRGLIGAVARRVLRVLTFDLLDRVGGEVGEHFVKRWEEKTRPHRLRAFGPDDYNNPDVAALDEAAIRRLGPGPALLFIHGTNSLSHSGFGKLPRDAMAAFAARYEGRVFAFDHPTLSLDPVENCKVLASMLPDDVSLDVDVLAHSRGGLVARVLSELPGEASSGSKLRVRQIVFVATPNRGTPLADPAHLGSLLDGLTNLLDLIPDNPVTDSLAGIVAVVKQLAVGAAKGLDGLMAMNPRLPDNPFLSRLNTPRDQTTLYRAVAADYEPTPGTARARLVRDGLMDGLFSWEANDLIVPTAGTYSWNGASGFPIMERLDLAPVRGVDHSTYWTAPEVLDAFTGWLSPEEAALRPRQALAPVRSMRSAPPMAEVDERLAAGDVEGVRAAVAQLPQAELQELQAQVGEVALDSFLFRGAEQAKAGVVFVLPGIMGTNLWGAAGESDRIWLEPLGLVRGDFRRLRVGAPGAVRPGGLYRGYLPLVVALGARWDVVPVGFDWRLSLADASDHLAERIVEHGGGAAVPAHLVCHSMGGLVARMLIARHPDVWTDIDNPGDRNRGGRLVMLGTPNLGSLAPALVLTGDDQLVRWLARIDLQNDRDEVRRILATMQGTYELLAAGDVDVEGSAHKLLFDAASWEAGFIDQGLLGLAAETHRLLARQGHDADRFFYVAGSGHDTPAAVRIDGPGKFSYRMTRAGDGRVTHELGIPRDPEGKPLAGERVWYSTATHGDLTKDGKVVAAVVDLLSEGTTSRLGNQVPAEARGGVPASADVWVPAAQVDPPDVEAEGLDRSLRSPAVRRSQRRAAVQRAADLAVEGWLGSAPAPDHPVTVVHVSVLHASLEYSSHAVIVGHYRGDPLGGAEGYLDTRLGGRLSRHQLLDRYPEAIGEVLRLQIGNGSGQPPGALVVGLGERGDLTPTKLAAAVRDAALEHAMAWLDQRDASSRTDATRNGMGVGLSTVLLGSYGDAGITLRESLSAIVEGVVLANGLLSERCPGEPARITSLEFVERYAAPAEAAAHAIRDIASLLPGGLRRSVELRPSQCLRPGEGRRPAVHNADYAAGMWQRLIVSTAAAADENNVLQLQYTSLGARARAEQLNHRVTTDLLGRMVRDAVTRPSADGQVNIAMFEMLFPNDVKRELSGVENLQLVLDDAAADFPWEALSDRGGLTGARPLGLRTGLLRQLKTEGSIPVDPRTGSPVALVVGDPPGGPGFARLDGARREAQQVADRLFEAMPVERQIFSPDPPPNEDSAARVVAALLADDYQIVHIAGHGHFEEPKVAGGEPYGGAVIGPHAYLTASIVANMRRPPDIVFLNCCHLASVGAVVIDNPAAGQAQALTRQNLNRLAASLSRQLMKSGVRAVLAAGWSVSDAPAARFAVTFYDAMLSGADFGEAVRAARQAAFDEDEGASNTWAAYQCYGDPGFRLVPKNWVAAKASLPVSAEELVRRLEEIQVDADEATGDALDALRLKLDGLQDAGVREWPGDARVWAALGEAHGALAAMERAIGCYRTALACRDAALPIKAVEQLANLENRLAVDLRAGGMSRAETLDPPATVDALRRSAKARLDALDRLSKSSERHAMRAGWYAREAIFHAVSGDARGRATNVTKSAQEYVEAWRLSSDEPPERKLYGALNALQLAALGADVPPETIAELEQTMARERPDAHDFWDRVAEGDTALTLALRGDTVDTTVDAIAATYRRTFVERSSPRERRTVVEQVLELAELAEGKTAEGLRRLAATLTAS